MSDLRLNVIINAVTEGLRRGVNEAVSDVNTMWGRLVSGGRAGIGGLIALFTSLHAMIGGALVGVMINAAVGIARGFDVINASIKTATKGLENEAIPALKEFAKTTPYDLAQVSESFVKLVNFGLTPSEEALTSYGNTASALGKNLNQMVEAVADAVTGEFERLKEFGIKSKVEGDSVIFTFQGVQTKVKNNAAAIEGYLIKLGQVNFAGAMADRAKTLDGALSNLGDSWSNLVLTIMQSGFSDLIAENARSASASLDGISQYIQSGIIQANIATITTAFDGMAKDVAQSMGIVTGFIKDQFKQWEISGGSTARTLTTEFQDWLNNTRTFIKLMTVEVASMWDKIKIMTDSSLQSMRKPMEAQQEQLDGINKARQDSIATILNEHAVQKAANTEAINASDAIVKSLEREAEAHRKNEQDRLAKFKIGGPSAGGDSSKTKKTKKAKAAKPPVESEMHGFEQGLTERKIAFERENTLREFSKKEEKAYWDTIIATYHGNSKTLADLKKKSSDLDLQIIREAAKEKESLQKESFEAEHAVALDALDEKEAASQQELDLGTITQEQYLANLRNFAAERLAIEQKLLDDKRKLLNNDALALAQNLHEKEALTRAGAAKIQSIDNQDALARKEHFKQMFAPLENALDQSVNGVISGQQTIKNAVKNAGQSIVLSYATTFIKTRVMSAAQWAWEAAGFAGKEAKKKAIENASFIWEGLLWAKKKAMLAGQWAWDVLGFGTAESTKTAIKVANEGAQTGAAVGADIIQTTSKIAAEETKQTVTAKTASKSIMAKAYDAAAGVYSSLSDIPYVGWILAPIAAAATFITVAGWASMVGSAKGGEWQVGEDGSPYILHKDESVLPAGVAEGWRKVVSIVNTHVDDAGTGKKLSPADEINQLFASGQLKPLELPDFALNLTRDSQTAANGLARDRVKADKERLRNPVTGGAKSGDNHIHIHGIALAPEDFFRKNSRHVVSAATHEARKFNNGKKQS